MNRKRAEVRANVRKGDGVKIGQANGCNVGRL